MKKFEQSEFALYRLNYKPLNYISHLLQYHDKLSHQYLVVYEDLMWSDLYQAIYLTLYMLGQFHQIPLPLDTMEVYEEGDSIAAFLLMQSKCWLKK